MFRGRFEHTVDKKGRVSIPSGFRMEIQRRSDNSPVLNVTEDYLSLFPADVWEEKENRWLEMSEYEADSIDYQRAMAAEAIDCPVDNQGRILIPSGMREDAGLNNKVIITGVLNRIEIWSPERYEEKKAATRTRLAEIQKSVGAQTRPRGD
jgi:MraZ protein